MVYLRAYSTLIKYLKDARAGESVPLEVDAAATINAVVSRLGVADGEIYLISVNGRVEGRDCVLQPGDVISLFAPIAGGAEERRYGWQTGNLTY